MIFLAGRVLAKDPHGATHVLVMRFASKEALDTYMDDSYRIEISYKTIVPFFNVRLSTPHDSHRSGLLFLGESCTSENEQPCVALSFLFLPLQESIKKLSFPKCSCFLFSLDCVF